MTPDKNVVQREIELANRFIERSYLNDLIECNVVPMDAGKKRFAAIRLFKVCRLIYEKNSNINDKLVSVFNSIQSLRSNLVMVLHGNSSGIELYIGIHSNMEAGIAEKAFSKSFMGNFPGSMLEKSNTSDTEYFLRTATDYEHRTPFISCLNIVPAIREDAQSRFVQGLENFVDTMKGETYTCFIIASSVTDADCETRMSGYEQLYSAIFPFTNVSLSHGTNEGLTLSTSFTDSITDTIGKSITQTIGYSETDSEGEGRSFNIGLLGLGINRQTGHATSVTSGTAITSTDSRSEGHSQSDSEAISTSISDNFTMSHKDKVLEDTIERIEQQITRIKECMTFGMWDCAAYFIADNAQTSVVAANTFRSLMVGGDGNNERINFNLFGVREKENTAKIAEYLRYCQHPVFELDKAHSSQHITPTNFISGKELPLLINLPRKAVAGLPIMSIAEFGRNVSADFGDNVRTIDLGHIYHMDSQESTAVSIDLDSLASHCFITGSTGSGKSNTVFRIVEELIDKRNNVPFLIIEPAKGEYKHKFSQVPDINIFCTNASVGQFLKINPFRFDSNIHILEHLDRLIEIFNTCWEMYAAMPAILKDAIEKAYEGVGWDLVNSIYLNEGEPQYPTFKDLLTVLPNVINKAAYSSDTKSDYIGALVTRVQSLTNGIIGQIFCDCYDISDRELFDERTIVDLSRIGSSETKSLLMGVLVLRLSEYRMSHTSDLNTSLRHVTILEEAHNLLKNTHDSAAPSSGVVGKSVEMICNTIAEVRAYGEGFIIVDQSPTSVDIAAIKNTNTKIIMRLPDIHDCEIAGRSTSLTNEQIAELAKLKTGVAVVMQNNWNEASLVKINLYSEEFSKHLEYISGSSIKALKGMVVSEILNQYTIEKTKSITDILEKIEFFDIDIAKKRDASRVVEAICGSLDKKWSSKLLGTALMQYLGCESAFKLVEQQMKAKFKDEVSLESASAMNAYVIAEIEKYVAIDDLQRRKLIQYLTYAKCFETSSINYDGLYRLIYNIK